MSSTRLCKACEDLTLRLRKACKEGLVGEVRESIEAGADPNITWDQIRKNPLQSIYTQRRNRNKQSSHTASPLQIASGTQSLGIVRCLLDHGADVNFQTRSHAPSLHIACSADVACLPIVQCLVQHGASVNEDDALGNRPLHLACEKSNRNIVQFLIEQGADMNKPNTGHYRETPLFVACRLGSLEVAWTLIKRGVDVQVKYSSGLHTPDIFDGYTPLHFAGVRNDEQFVSYLIDQGIDVNSKSDIYGYTPLSLAANSGKPGVIQCLLKGGANVNTVDNRLRTPLHDACGRDSPEIALLLIQNGANVHAADNQGETPLHEACWDDFCIEEANLIQSTSRRPPTVAKYLLENGADLEARGFRNRTPLHVACESNARWIVKFLLQHSVCANVKEEDGNTPLHSALHNKYTTDIGVIICLLQHGADPTALSTSGRSPFQSITPEHSAAARHTVFGIWAGMSAAAENDVDLAQLFLTDAACSRDLGAVDELLFTNILFANIPLLPLNHRDVLSAHIKSCTPWDQERWIRIRDLLCEWLDTYTQTLKTLCRAPIRRHLGPALIPRIRPFYQSYPTVLVEYIFLYHDARAVFADDVSVIDELFGQ